MDHFSSQSLFRHITSRELNGFRVRKRPCMDAIVSCFSEIGAIAVDHNGSKSPPLAVSFCKTAKNSHIVALSDEDGYVNLFDTRRKFPSSASYQKRRNHLLAEKSKICDWVAHQNALFDVCWVKEDAQILTASGDQTMKLWDVEANKCIGVLMGHTGSVKSMCSHPTDAYIIISGSRDGSFRLWDMRCNSTSNSRHGELRIDSTAVVKRAHLSSQAKGVRSAKAASTSITSVLYLKDQISIATAGAADRSVGSTIYIKYCQVMGYQKPESLVTQACPRPGATTEKERLHGISSLSQDDSGLFVSASCMDNRVYLYSVLQLEKGPLRSFSGCRIESFFSAISPDATHIVSGPSDGNAYIWQVNKPLEDPIALKSHDGEVTAVDWCHSEVGKLATCSDDFTVRIWNKSSYFSNTRSPSSILRRVMAMPSTECRKLLMNDEAMCQKPITPPEMRTPECQKKRFLSCSDQSESSEKTPESTLQSPSSVLNPPSSLKRTIRDYFLAVS